ncbi:MAG: carbohydrate ABC transporter permease [Anaerolineae bacterium]
MSTITMEQTVRRVDVRYVLRRRLLRALTYLALITGSIIFSIPFFWLITTSLKPTRQIVTFPPQWIPDPIVWGNYTDVFLYAPFDLYFRNTMFIVAFHLLGAVGTCSLVAYAFARLRAPGRDVLFGLLLSTMMVPAWVTLVPLYLLFSKIGWINTFYPLIVPALTGNAFYIFLLRQFFLTLPRELEDAALIDGAGYFAIWWRLVLPLSAPALATVAIFSFMGTWNEFIGPLIFLNSRTKYTLALGLQVFVREHGADFGLLMAASTMMIMPIIVMFFFMQRQFVQGITLTGMKG